MSKVSNASEVSKMSLLSLVLSVCLTHASAQNFPSEFASRRSCYIKSVPPVQRVDYPFSNLTCRWYLPQPDNGTGWRVHLISMDMTHMSIGMPNPFGRSIKELNVTFGNGSTWSTFRVIRGIEFMLYTDTQVLITATIYNNSRFFPILPTSLMARLSTKRNQTTGFAFLRGIRFVEHLTCPQLSVTDYSFELSEKSRAVPPRCQWSQRAGQNRLMFVRVGLQKLDLPLGCSLRLTVASDSKTELCDGFRRDDGAKEFCDNASFKRDTFTREICNPEPPVTMGPFDGDVFVTLESTSYLTNLEGVVVEFMNVPRPVNPNCSTITQKVISFDNHIVKEVRILAQPGCILGHQFESDLNLPSFDSLLSKSSITFDHCEGKKAILTVYHPNSHTVRKVKCGAQTTLNFALSNALLLKFPDIRAGAALHFVETIRSKSLCDKINRQVTICEDCSGFIRLPLEHDALVESESLVCKYTLPAIGTREIRMSFEHNMESSEMSDFCRKASSLQNLHSQVVVNEVMQNNEGVSAISQVDLCRIVGGGKLESVQVRGATVMAVSQPVSVGDSTRIPVFFVKYQYVASRPKLICLKDGDRLVPMFDCEFGASYQLRLSAMTNESSYQWRLLADSGLNRLVTDDQLYLVTLNITDLSAPCWRQQRLLLTTSGQENKEDETAHEVCGNATLNVPIVVQAAFAGEAVLSIDANLGPFDIAITFGRCDQQNQNWLCRRRLSPVQKWRQLLGGTHRITRFFQTLLLTVLIVVLLVCVGVAVWPMLKNTEVVRSLVNIGAPPRERIVVVN